MRRSIATDELTSRLAQLDQQLEAWACPLHLRPLECFKAIYGSVSDNEGRSTLFAPIMEWFTQKHGFEAMNWDEVVGRVPIILRNRLYLVLVPFVTEEKLVSMVDQIDDAPADLIDSLSQEELSRLNREIQGPAAHLGFLYSLSADDVFLSEDHRQMIKRAGFDLNNAALTLKTSDVQTAIFQAHAAVEKFLKVILQRADRTAVPKSFGHDARKLFAELIAVRPELSWLEPSVTELQRLLAEKMSIRYSILNRTSEDGVTALHASIYVCGTIALLLLFEDERGSARASFTPSRFYLDGFRRTHYCTRVSADGSTADLMLFHSNKFIGSQIIEQRVESKIAVLYLEIVDPAEISRLQNLLRIHWINRGTRLNPAEMISSSSGPRGTYWSVSVKAKIDPEA